MKDALVLRDPDAGALVDVCHRLEALGEAIRYLEDAEMYTGVPIGMLCRLGAVVADYSSALRQAVGINFERIDAALKCEK